MPPLDTSSSGPRNPLGNAPKRVRDALWETIVAPVLNRKSATRILGFRLVWSRKDVVEEEVWAQMAQYRYHMDSTMCSVRGPAFFISSISANVSHQGKNTNVIPCIGYYVVVDDPSFVESNLYIPMRENPFGAALKLMNLPHSDKEDRRLLMLSKLVKDYGREGYVRRKMDQYGQRDEPLVVAYVCDRRYEDTLLAASAVLRESIGMDMTLKNL